MQIGVVFPQTEMGSDRGLIRDFAQLAEHLGYRHILAFDHVLGADADRRPALRVGAYDETSAIHEVFVFFGYLAAPTSRIGLATGVLVLPQRQTALVAKQAAEFQILSGGRPRLGIGTGWNHVEFDALGVPFQHRRARQAEHVGVFRQLWTEPVMEFSEDWHQIERAGLDPLPHALVALERVKHYLTLKKTPRLDVRDRGDRGLQSNGARRGPSGEVDNSAARVARLGSVSRLAAHHAGKPRNRQRPSGGPSRRLKSYLFFARVDNNTLHHVVFESAKLRGKYHTPSFSTPC